MFGDKDPEDAYDAGDPPDVKLRILERVVESLRTGNDARRAARRDDALRLVLVLGRERDVDTNRLRAIRDALEAL